MKAPFPYFGGKSRVAPVVWERFGDVRNYVEPFFGSGAVLLNRPQPFSGVETVNDADGLLANFWRAVQHAPDEVARHADWPVNEADLHPRHLWLVGQREALTERLMGDAGYFDAQAAGWWVWGCCQWIGTGWCSGEGSWVSVDGQLVKADAGGGINRKLPHLGDAGKGINRGLPHLSDAGMGINRKLPHLTGSRGEYLLQTFTDLKDRLRDVRVVCGDWTRVMGQSVTRTGGATPCGIFLDPPYATETRSTTYTHDSTSIAHDVRAWCLENGDNDKLRIALCGYDGEHNELLDVGWSVHNWKANGGYGGGRGGQGNANRHRERIWFSPHCLNEQQPRLF